MTALALHTFDGLDINDKWLGYDVSGVFKAIKQMDRYFCIVKQIGIKDKVGSIHLPQQAVDDQTWTTGLGLVLKVGKSAYRGRKFEEMGLAPEDAPEPGDIVWFSGRNPHRIWIDKEVYFALGDDGTFSRINREWMHLISFGKNL